MIDFFDLQNLILISVLSFFLYREIKQQYFIYKSFIFLMFINSLLSLNFYVFDIYFNKFIVIINIIIIYLIYCLYRTTKIKSCKINKKNVCIIFYKPKTFTQSLKGVVGSAGLIIGDKLYQLRYESEFLQERDYTKEYVYSKYLVIDTGFKIKDLKGNWKQEILNKKRITFYGIWRLNCLRSLAPVLNQIKGFEYKGEILPSIYLNKIK